MDGRGRGVGMPGGRNQTKVGLKSIGSLTSCITWVSEEIRPRWD